MINHKFWFPTLTSQFSICPIPFHMDTYRGCVNGCLYCFARDFTTFSRRNSEHREFSYLEGNRPDLFEKWVERVINSEDNFNKGNEIALKERIPLKIGATSDPFPLIEDEEKITLSILKVLEKYDYPVEIQTKNPNGLVHIMDKFKNPNWAIAVTIISTDNDFIKICEPNAPTSQERFDAIKKLTDYGIKVMVKIQPAIYPKIIVDLPNLIKAIKESGCWAFNTEGLKIRISMPKKEQLLIQTIGDYLGINMREYYKKEGEKTGSDWEIKTEKKKEYILLADKLAKEYNLQYFVADNNMGKIGCGSECCGTQVLRNYKIWGNNKRTKYFYIPDYCSTKLGKCYVNFGRNKKNKDKTLDYMMEQVFKKKDTQMDLFVNK
jgi:DNA repair photolyase